MKLVEGFYLWGLKSDVFFGLQVDGPIVRTVPSNTKVFLRG